MADTTKMKLKYFVLNPGASDPAYAKASHAAMLEFCVYLRANGEASWANEVEEWANDQWKARQARVKAALERRRKATK